MAQVINTNSLSLLTQNNLNKSQLSLNTAIERLSSGMRINSAKDDAAGQAIANRFTANIKGLTQASRNANDGISIAQVTEGSLTQVNSNLQRVRELAVQAATGTNSQSDLDSIQDEIGQRLAEIDRVSQQTQFNGVNVLSDKAGKLTVQVGANDGETIDIDLQEISAKTLGLGKLDAASQTYSKDLKATGANITEAVAATKVDIEYVTAAGAITLKVASAGTDAGKLVATDGTDYYAATFDSATNTVTYNTSTKLAAANVTAAAGTAFVDGNGDLVELADIDTEAARVDGAAAINFDTYLNKTTGAYKVSDGTSSWAATVNLATGKVTLGAKDAALDGALAAGSDKVTTDKVLTVPGTVAVAFDMAAVNAALTGTNALLKSDKDGSYVVKNTAADGTVTNYKATANAADGKVTVGEEIVVDPLAAIDKALAKVDQLRSSLGAVQNRFDSVIANLGTTVTNLSSSRSRIEDADYAVEVSNMTRAQILQQAGTSVLAQANQTTQGVLSLLR